MGTGVYIRGKRNIIDVGEWPQVCRRGKNTYPNTVYYSFKTPGSKDIVIRKVVGNSVSNVFYYGTNVGGSMERQAGERNSQVFSYFLTLCLEKGAQLDVIKQHESEQTEKAAAKVEQVDGSFTREGVAVRSAATGDPGTKLK